MAAEHEGKVNASAVFEIVSWRWWSIRNSLTLTLLTADTSSMNNPSRDLPISKV